MQVNKELGMLDLKERVVGAGRVGAHLPHGGADRVVVEPLPDAAKRLPESKIPKPPPILDLA